MGFKSGFGPNNTNNRPIGFTGGFGSNNMNNTNNRPTGFTGGYGSNNVNNTNNRPTGFTGGYGSNNVNNTINKSTGFTGRSGSNNMNSTTNRTTGFSGSYGRQAGFGNHPSRNLQFYSESFSQRPDREINQQNKALSQSSGDSVILESELSMMAERKVRESYEALMENEEVNHRAIYQQQLLDQNQIMIMQQQQQQWLQLIEMNNQMQTQFSMQFMNQPNLSQSKKKKRKSHK